jgi:hypothetical protein
MLARALVCLLFLSGTAHAQTQLVVGATVVKRVQLNLQGDRLEVRSNSREGVLLNLGTTTIVLPAGVHVLRLPPGAPPRITASPL